MWQICRIEFAFDHAIATKQAAIGNLVPLRYEMRRDQDRFSALGFEAQFLLKPFSPVGIEAKARLIEQKDWSVGKQKESEAE